MEVFLVFADEWGEENDGSGVEAFVFFFFFRQWLIGSDCSRGGENRVASSFCFLWRNQEGFICGTFIM